MASTDFPFMTRKADRANSIIYSRADLIASITAESNALAVATVANWLDVNNWRIAVTSADESARFPDRAAAYASVKEFDFEITCDTDTETITSPALYGIREAPLTVANDTFTATAATPSVVTATAHGLETGDGPFRLTSSGTLPAGMSTGTDYWIEKIDANTYYLATSRANALASTRVAASDTGTGTHTISDKQTADGFKNSDDHTKRLHFCYMGDLNGGSTITVGKQTAYVERIQHSPLNLYYAVLGTSGTGAQTCTIRCVPVQTVEW